MLNEQEISKPHSIKIIIGADGFDEINNLSLSQLLLLLEKTGKSPSGYSCEKIPVLLEEKIKTYVKHYFFDDVPFELDFLELHLPNYFQNQDVLTSDILSKHLSNELDDGDHDDDVAFVKDNYLDHGLDVAVELILLESKLYREALTAKNAKVA